LLPLLPLLFTLPTTATWSAPSLSPVAVDDDDDGQNQWVVPAPGASARVRVDSWTAVPVSTLTRATDTEPLNGNGASLVTKQVPVVVHVAIWSEKVV
jgi:hypothetical protein